MTNHHGLPNCKELDNTAGVRLRDAESLRQQALCAERRGDREKAKDLWFDFKEAVRSFQFAAAEEDLS